ncbi:MAG: sugar phosphate isomerase/epimerase [Bilifractor sp.]|nr:sugar phosphate isomerase/epimerase [Eubacterium sp.]MDY2837151.1 sugar phosphate isomerase/epimerase [Bilifractor sp.]
MSNKLPVGIQVYGLRDLLEKTPDRFPEVMQSIKDMGYDGVELAGLYGLEPEYIKETLEKIGLNPISAHVPLVDMMADPQGIADTYKKIGVKYIAVPYLPEEYRPNVSAEGYKKVIEEMTRIGRIFKENGIKLEYHNHDFEFVKMPDGSFCFDDIYTQIPEDLLKVEPDLCWIKVAGQKPVEYLKKYGARCEVVHLKDFIKEGNPKNMYKLIGTTVKEEEGDDGIFEFRPVGFGMQIWEPILDTCTEIGAKWVVVEQDEHYSLDPLEAARRSREYLKILGW